MLKTTAKDIGRFLEEQARKGEPVTYSQVIQTFSDLPPLTAYWKSHPLCWLFGELDEEDHRNGNPLRTALVFAKETGRPGQGFFDTIEKYRHLSVLKSDQDAVWVAELNSIKAMCRP